MRANAASLVVVTALLLSALGAAGAKADNCQTLTDGAIATVSGTFVVVDFHVRDVGPTFKVNFGKSCKPKYAVIVGYAQAVPGCTAGDIITLTGAVKYVPPYSDEDGLVPLGDEFEIRPTSVACKRPAARTEAVALKCRVGMGRSGSVENTSSFDIPPESRIEIDVGVGAPIVVTTKKLIEQGQYVEYQIPDEVWRKMIAARSHTCTAMLLP